MRCPICKKPLPAQQAGFPAPAYFPFCSERCKLIDLGRWLDGRYQIPVAEEEDSDAAPSHPTRDRLHED